MVECKWIVIFPIEKIPESQEELINWCQEAWTTKENLLKNFYSEMKQFLDCQKMFVLTTMLFGRTSHILCYLCYVVDLPYVTFDNIDVLSTVWVVGGNAHGSYLVRVLEVRGPI